VSEILDDRMQQGFTHLIVAGNLNDGPPSAGLAPLLSHPASRTRSCGSRARSIRQATRHLRTWQAALDYLLLSPAVSSAAQQAGIERRGHFTKRLRRPFDTVTSERLQASDHHAVWVYLAL
jgi:UDP-N-acetylmuramoylalanine-D-glutamate ligase